MQQDSRRFSCKSGHLTGNQILPRQTPVQSYQCSHCVLIFTSKRVLLEHLGKVHDLDVYDALRHATSMDDAGQNIKPKNDNPGHNCASALQPEENKLNKVKVNVNKQVAVEKSNSHIAKPTSKDKLVANLAGRVKVNQKTSRKITQYFTASSVPNVKSSFKVKSPNEVGATNTAKKTLISRNSNPAPYQSNDCTFPFKSCISLPSELDFQLATDRTKTGLEDPVTPPTKKPKLGLIKIQLPTCAPRKSHFPDSSRLMLEFSDSEEDHKLPKDEMNHEEHPGNADISSTKQMEANPSKQCPMSKAVQAEFYKCYSCTFGHKSVVGMLVHYQKQHPKLGVTLDQIKQSRCVVSDTKPLVLPETSSEYLNMDTPNQDKPMASSDKNASSEKTKDKLPPEENVSAVNPKDFPDTPSQKQHKISTVCNDGNPALILSHQKTQHGIVSSSPREVNPPATAQIEAEKSPVICHTQISKKSPTSAPLTPPKNDCAIVDNALLEKESCGGIEAPASPTDGLQDKVDYEQKEAVVKEKASHGKIFEKFFFCPMCNYGNRYIRAMLVHCRIRHRESSSKLTANTISSYTASIHRQMKKSKSQNDKISVLSSGLPLPIVHGEGMFFCHLCNYPNSSLCRVLDHQRSTHPGTGKAEKQVLAYTAEVYDQPREEQLKFEVKRIVSVTPPSPVQSEIENVQTSLPGNSIPVSKKTEEKNIHPFICHKCAYTTSNVYLLKRHLSRRHLIRQTAAMILRNAFEKGFIKEGYYCQWCNFSDKKATRVHEHCKQVHKSNSISITHITDHLHVAPEDATSKKPSDIESPVPSQGSGSKDPRTYSCQLCPFKGSSQKGITNHYLKVHLQSAGEKGSVLDGIGSGGDNKNSHTLEADGHHDVPASLDNYQALQELESSPSLSPLGIPSSDAYMCRFCSALFTTRHGLKIHYGMKHIDQWNNEPFNFDDHAVIESGMMISALVHKCPWCRYVHTTVQGMVTHCLKKHSTKKARAQGFESVTALLPQGCNGKSRQHSGRIRIGGHLCQFCQEVHHSVAKMKVHYRNNHKDYVPSVKPTAKYVIRLKAFLVKNQPGLMKCPFCNHKGRSKDAFTRHIKLCSENKKMRHVFKCSICSYVTLTGRYLTKHYKLRHGIQSNTPAMEYTDVRYNCRLCPYVSSKSRYLISHYTKAHAMEDPEEFEDNKSLKCKKCKNLVSFSSYNRLSIHYTSFHRTHVKMDFKVLYRSSKKSAVAGYTCHHCSLKLKTIKELCCHLENHREEKRKTVKLSSVAVTTPIHCNGKGESPKLQTIPKPEPVEEPLGAAAQACKHCGRGFSSLVDLRMHERSHEAVAALHPQDMESVAWSEVFESVTKVRPGTLKPFHCCICGYRTNLLCLLKSHVLKRHSGDLPDMNAGPPKSVKEEESGPKAADDRPPAPPPPDPQEDDSLSPWHATKTSQHAVYSEPAEVQRQLSHYRSMPPANTAPLSAPDVPELPDDDEKLLHCEFCDFSSEHQSSVRRHYINIHGKRLLRCKDCSFFTGIRKNLDLHKEMGHSTCQMEPTHQKTLRCPLCLYHTKNQNHMIDHVVLHRQERVVPIEVRRPKLSRYLTGVVFRCHECTFTSGSAANLRTHALKHNNVRPYQCRLCYFDCTQLSELEEHLCDKHQVVRNHELVGQVNLDHLGARAGHEPEGDEEGDDDGGSNPREANDEDEDAETEGCDGAREPHKERGVDTNTAAPPHGENVGELEGHAQQVDDEMGSPSRKEEEERQARREPTEGEVEEELSGVVSEPGDEGTACDGPDGRAAVSEDGQNHESLPDVESQKSSTAAEGQPLAATHATNRVARTADTERLEKPFLSLEDEQVCRRRSDDSLGSPEMPVLENVYLNQRDTAAATWRDANARDSLRCDARERRETPEEIPWEGSANKCPVQAHEAVEGTQEAETSLSKGTPADGVAGGFTRPFAKDDGAFSCALCGRIFSNDPELQQHIKRHGT